MALQPEQARLLEAVAAGDCLAADGLPPVPEAMRHPPKPTVGNAVLL